MEGRNGCLNRLRAFRRSCEGRIRCKSSPRVLFVISAVAILGSMGIALGAAAGLLARRRGVGRGPKMILTLLLVAAALVPFAIHSSSSAAFVRGWNDPEIAVGAYEANIERFLVRAWSVIAVSFLFGLIAAIYAPPFASLTPAAAFVAYWTLALPELSAPLPGGQHGPPLDNTPNIWLFIYSAVAVLTIASFDLSARGRFPQRRRDPFLPGV